MTKLKLITNEGIRRVNIADAQLTYNSLRSYGEQLFPRICQADVIFSWTDDEGDEILVSSNIELREAIDVLKSMDRGYIKLKMMQVNGIDLVGPDTTSSRKFLIRELKNRSMSINRGLRRVIGAQRTQCQVDNWNAAQKSLSAFFPKTTCHPPRASRLSNLPALVTLRAKVVEESSIPPGLFVPQGEVCTVHKTWRIRNVGTEEWPAQTRLVAVGGGEGFPLCGPRLQLSPSATILSETVPVGGEVTISVDLPVCREPAPSLIPHLRTANFRLRTPSRCCFGDIISARVDGCAVEPPAQKWRQEVATLSSLGLVSSSNYGHVCNLLEQLVGNANPGSDAHHVGIEAVIMTLVVRRSLA